MKPRLLHSVLMISVLVGVVVGASQAFFSDTETSVGNIFQAGSFDLLVNGENDPEGIVNIQDLKPGDNQVVEKILRLNDNPGKVWVHLKDLEATQGAQTEPEEQEEQQLGGPKFDLENYIFYDLTIGEEVLIATEDGVLLSEAESCWIPLSTIPGGEDVTMWQSFHLPSEVTNWAQGDTLSFIEEFWAIQDRHNPDQQPPDTGSGRVWNPELKKCVDQQIACVETYADSFSDNNQGLRKNGTTVPADRSNPSFAFGAPQTTGTATDVVVPSSFFSLGFPHDNNANVPGSIVLGFANPFLNGPGDDLQIFETTGGIYPDEKVKVEVAANPAGPWTLLTAAGIRDVSLDLGLMPSAQYVRLTDASNIGLFEDTADGYDLDAVKALCGRES